MPSWTYFTHYGSASSPVGRYGEPRKKRSRPIRTKAEHAPINQRQRCSPTRKPGHATHRASAFACRYWSVPVQAAAFIESRRLWQSARDATPKKHRRCVMKDWTPSALLHASGMYWESCAIHAAVHLDVFTPLSGGPMTVTELADRTGSRPPKPRPPSNRPVCNGPVDPSRRNLRTAALLAGSPVPGQSTGYLGHIVEHHRHLMPGWSKLDESVPREQADPPPLFRRYRRYGRAGKFPHWGSVQNIANAQAERSVPHIDLSGRSHLLDLGGATGAYAIHFCRRNPGLSATVFDLPTTRPFAERVIADSGMADRILLRGRGFYHRRPSRRIRRGLALPDPARRGL